MTVIREPAPCKLNVFLRVRGGREDGYHEIETLILPLTLADGVEAAPAGNLTLRLTGPLAREVPADGNLVLAAARALAAARGRRPNARLTLVKRVPVAAGLGGGSADAAAALRALNDLWSCGMSRERLADVAAAVGSDVPALVLGGPTLVAGRGERVEGVDLPRTWWVLLPAAFGVSAADAYGWWDEDDGTSGPDPTPLLEALRAGDAAAAGLLLFNDLEDPVASRHPGVAAAKGRLIDAGALASVMCGSGPTVAGLCGNGSHAEEVASRTGGIAVASVSAPAAGG